MANISGLSLSLSFIVVVVVVAEVFLLTDFPIVKKSDNVENWYQPHAEIPCHLVASSGLLVQVDGELF